MFTKGTKPGQYKFATKPTNAKKVLVAGDFNGWKPAAMRKQTDGSFALTVTLRPGSYEYKFIVDGNWIEDPENSTWALNPYGTINSVATAV